MTDAWGVAPEVLAAALFEAVPAVILGGDDRVVVASRAFAALIPGAEPGVLATQLFSAGHDAAAALRVAREGGRTAMQEWALASTGRVLGIQLVPLASGPGDVRILLIAQDMPTLSPRAAVAAHDINNLFAAVVAGVESAREHGGGGAVAADLDDIAGAAGRGSVLVRRLFGQAESPVSMPAIDLNAAARALAPLLRRALGEQVTMVLDHDETVPLAYADADGLDGALLNLALNAGRAMPQGGRLTLRTGRRTMLAGDGADPVAPGDYGLIEVADTGVGIAADLLPGILDPYATTKPDRYGHGLGLASVAATVRGSGGFLTIASTLGQGTTVSLHFPVAAPVTGDLGQGRLVLLVEDEASLRGFAARALTRRGWEVLSVDSAESARELAESRLGEISLVVADFSLPGADGATLIRELLTRRRDLAALLLSGYDCVEHGLEGVAFLAKPFSLASLARACAKACERC